MIDTGDTHTRHFAMDPATTFGEVRVRESTKCYCPRFMYKSSGFITFEILECFLPFKVDKNISVIGLQVPTQITDPLNNTTTSIYTESLYAHILDSNGSRLTYTHLTTSASYGSSVEVCFNSPAYIEKNKIYRICVIFKKAGRYPIGECSMEASCEGIHFSFGDTARDGLIRSIVFRHQ